MKKNIKILFTLLIAFTIMLPFGVVSAEVGSGSAIGSTNLSGGGAPEFTEGDWKKTHTYQVELSWGVRVSLVKNDGNNVGDTSPKNFFNSRFNPYGNYIYYDSNNRSKKDVTEFNPTSISTIKGGTDITGYKDVILYTDSNGNKITISGLLSANNSYKNLADKLSGYADASDASSIKILDDFIYNTFGKRFTTDTAASDWYLLIEPIQCITKDEVKKSGKNQYICGTTTEFSVYAYANKYYAPKPLNGYIIHYAATWNYLYINSSSTTEDGYVSFSSNGKSSVFKGFKVGTGKTSNYIETQVPYIIDSTRGDGVGLIWLGKNAKPKHTCSEKMFKDRFPIVRSDNGRYVYNPNSGNNPISEDISDDDLAFQCGLSEGPACVKYADSESKIDNKKIWDGTWKYDNGKATLSAKGTDTRPSLESIRNNCGYQEYKCSDYGPGSKWGNEEIWTGDWKYNEASKDNIIKSTDNINTVRSSCGNTIARFKCSDYSDEETSTWKNVKIWNDIWKYNKELENNIITSEYSIESVRIACGKILCSSYSKKESTWNNDIIWKNGWTYDETKKDSVIKFVDDIDTVRSTCGKNVCKISYNTSENFTKVGESGENCCGDYESLFANDPNKLKRLYRDHPECYSCNYKERQINASCSSGENSSSTGDLFEKGTITYDEQTCAYYVAAGKVDTASSNLVTRREINPSCKVVCAETVDIHFPLVTQKSYEKGSYIIWPTNVALGKKESQLVLSGNTKCWYYINKVRLNNLYKKDATAANREFGQCVNDISYTYNNVQNIIEYNLRGNFAVKYNDSEYGKEIALIPDEVGKVKYDHSDSANIGILSHFSSASESNIDSLVELAESITYTVKQNVNYKINPNYGYNYIYQGKYYTLNMWGNSAAIIEKNNKPYSALGLKNELYKNGTLEITYSNIGGGSKLYSNTAQTYGTCKYETIDALVQCECPAGTLHAGMRLEDVMEKESLTCSEAIKKYCDKTSLTKRVCPPGTDYAGKNILDDCAPGDSKCIQDKCNFHGCIEDNENCRIEYRVIDLKNPFPGYSATVSNERIFNTTIKGRKPGSNWNAISLVKKEILNNRGVKGDAIYNLTPLYEFELTPSVIKKIREYNDKHEYDDFTLSCKGSNKQACVAEGFNFRSKDYGNVSVINNCNSINNIASFNSCYNNDRLG